MQVKVRNCFLEDSLHNEMDRASIIKNLQEPDEQGKVDWIKQY